MKLEITNKKNKMINFNKYFKYLPTGQLERTTTRNKGKLAGEPVKNKKGIKRRGRVVVDGKQYYRHHIVWMMHNGPIPEGMQIDHENRNAFDDKIENLRLTTPSQNSINRELSNKGEVEYRGVSKHHSGGFQARIKLEGKVKYLGKFDCKHRAAEAYNKAAIELHGEYAVLNKIKKK